jgi:hypothetical protein
VNGPFAKGAENRDIHGVPWLDLDSAVGVNKYFVGPLPTRHDIDVSVETDVRVEISEVRSEMRRVTVARPLRAHVSRAIVKQLTTPDDKLTGPSETRLRLSQWQQESGLPSLHASCMGSDRAALSELLV